MLFNTIDFVVFLCVVFALYWYVARNSRKHQNVLLLLASYFFYACWDWRFLFLLMFSTLLDQYTGLRMDNARKEKHRKRWFWLSIVVNLGFLGVFKYYDFFALSFAEAISGLGFRVDPWTINVILPVGISFYTFHGLSYVIDVYKKRIPAEKSLLDYSVFVSFFPLLVAGPIERATHLLPQIKAPRVFDMAKAVDGLRQILWGLFKKVVIADNCARFANEIFDNSDVYQGSALLLGAVFFAFQIYGDFSGYSDMALGTARLFGIDLLRNFAFPYFSRDIAEFWRRWHISLSSWFRDYLYIPLGGSKGATWMRVRNTLIIFLVSGFWHGANWTFILWGLLNALYIMPSILRGTNRKNMAIVASGGALHTAKEVLSIAATFGLTVLAWIFFRAESVTHAFTYLADLFTPELFQWPDFKDRALALPTVLLTVLFVGIEWIGRHQQYAIATVFKGRPWVYRWAFYGVLLAVIFVFAGSTQQFIYFQF